VPAATGAETAAEYLTQSSEVWPAGVAYTHPTKGYQTVNLGFGVEFMAGALLPTRVYASGAADRVDLMTNIMEYFGTAPTAPGTGTDDGGVFVNRLDHARPNPFNPTTTIAFSLAGRSRVTIRVYDLSGRVVRTLVDGDAEPGEHKVVWATVEAPTAIEPVSPCSERHNEFFGIRGEIVSPDARNFRSVGEETLWIFDADFEDLSGDNLGWLSFDMSGTIEHVNYWHKDTIRINGFEWLGDSTWWCGTYGNSCWRQPRGYANNWICMLSRSFPEIADTEPGDAIRLEYDQRYATGDSLARLACLWTGTARIPTVPGTLS
jgi:hypothetical protein